MLSRPMDVVKDGRCRRACLRALETPGTVAEVAGRLGWDYWRAASWVHYLKRSRLVVRVEWVRTPAGRQAGRYQAYARAER